MIKKLRTKNERIINDLLNLFIKDPSKVRDYPFFCLMDGNEFETAVFRAVNHVCLMEQEELLAQDLISMILSKNINAEQHIYDRSNLLYV